MSNDFQLLLEAIFLLKTMPTGKCDLNETIYLAVADYGLESKSS